MSSELARAWDEAAAGYDAYFVPRFRPWTELAIEAVASRAAALPPGPILVPCCGPGQELEPLRRATSREVRGSDLSPGMVERARARVAADPAIAVEVADAQALSSRWPGTAAALLSCFGLQQLPAPDDAIEDWARTLAPGGVLSVMSWPRSGDDEDGPSALLRKLAGTSAVAPWQDRLVARLERAGADVLEDRRVPFTMRHESAEALWDALTRFGPQRVLCVRHGQAWVDALRPRFVAELGPGPVEQRATARWLVAARPSVRNR